MFLRRNGIPVRRTVWEEWLLALPREKSQIFESAVRRWESSYAMMSVALDGAFSFRARGEVICASQQVCVAADLMGRLARSLVGFCDAGTVRSRNIIHLPLVEPMKIEFFRGRVAQSAASWNAFVHRVRFGDRSRFCHKLRLLSETLERLDGQFRETARELADEFCAQPGNRWNTLDCLHYDFNTCLREAEIILKALLRALPSDQLAAFGAELEAPVPQRLTRLGGALHGASA